MDELKLKDIYAGKPDAKDEIDSMFDTYEIGAEEEIH